MSTEKGNLSINSENIFPIIKKWLYSDHDIFYRELISNGCDAITKLKKLSMIGEFEEPEGNEYKIEVRVNQEEKTIKIIDNGIGMTADEVKEYINQIAFSGAADFLEKYKDKANEDQIIGHFGLGFYSAFMVAHKVTIDTLSYKKDAKAVHWVSEEGMAFEMSDSDRTERGTEITLYLNEDSYEFSNEYKAKEVLDKYCSFMPVPIYFVNENAKPEEPKADDNKDKKEGEEEEKKGPKPINEVAPLWTKHPNDCTEDEYKAFYRSTFHDYKEPLFWIHLNMDYPFNLKGILYFPKINMEYDAIEGTIKLYNNQVFIADNIKEVIPEFLLLLKGVLDCPDLPLNVSRSALQNDGFVNKISEYITKKVAEKLSGMCKTDKENYEKYWGDISPFIKYGCLKDDKFCEKMNDYILFKNLEGKYMTLPECLETKPVDIEEATDEEGNPVEEEVVEPETEEVKEDEKKEKIIYFVTDPVEQSQYVAMFKKAKMDAVLLTDNIDMPFINQLEMKNEGVIFKRIDEDLSDALKTKNSAKVEEELKANEEELAKLFKKIVKKDNIKVKLEKLKNKDISAMMTMSGETRKMQEMMRMYASGMGIDEFSKEGLTLVLNANNKLVQFLIEEKDGENVNLICEQLFDLALIQHGPLSPDEMTKFVQRSNKIMMILAK